MGESDRYFDYKRKKFSLGDDGNALMMLILINATIFLILSFVQIVYSLAQSPAGSYEAEVLQWLTLPAKLSTLAHKPWTLFTYMFTHTGLIGTITSMLWLWAFGSIFQDMAGNKKLIPLYIYGGLAGGIAFIASSYLFSKTLLDGAVILGSNAAIMAIAVATTTLVPDFRFFRNINGGIPIWILTLIYVVIDFAGVGGAGASHNISHIAGALTGFLFVISLRKGKDWSLWMISFYDWFINLFNPERKKVPVRKMREKVFYNARNQKPFVKRANITQQRVDEILDKINQKGYHLLTEEEKNILKRAGETDF